MIHTIILKEISKQEFINNALGPHINSGDIEIAEYIHSMPNLIRIAVRGNFNIRTIDATNIISIDSSNMDNTSLIEEHMIWEQEITTARDGTTSKLLPKSTYSDLRISSSNKINDILYDTSVSPTDTQMEYIEFKGTVRTPDYTGPTVATNWGITRCTLPNENFASASIASASSLPATPPVPVDEVSTYLEWSLDFDESEDPSTSGTTGDYEITSDPQGYLPVYGCTDPESDTYNPLAEIDDGSCEYIPVTILGCTNETANNYDPTANVDDGTCDYSPEAVYGCTDPTATNYDPTANTDNGSCTYPGQIIGCIDPTAINYNSSAEQDSGFCIYPDTTGVNDVDTQIIMLHPGWNMISTYIDVTNISNGDLQGIFTESLRDQHGNTVTDVNDYIQIVKTNTGQIWWPEFNFNGIGPWQVDEGYHLRVFQLCQLQINGPVIQSRTMEITEGWNIISFPFIDPINPEVLFEGYHDTVLILKANDASVWWPEYGFNGIGELQPGQGYQLKASETFTIPVNNTVNIDKLPTVLENELQVININVSTITSLKSVFSSWIDNSNRTVRYIFENYSYANNQAHITSNNIGKYIKEVRDATTQEVVYSTVSDFEDINYNTASGYIIEWFDEIHTLQSFQIRIPGSTMIYTTYNILAGANYLPVPVNRELDPVKLFAKYTPSITQLKDLSTGAVWWPTYGSNKVGNMVPSKVYLLVANEPFIINIPSA